MGSLRARRPTADRGAAAVEFALILPILLMVLFAIIDFGRMLNAQIVLSEAAREGARSMAMYDQDEGEDRVRLVGGQIGEVTPVVVSDCPTNPGRDDNAIMRAEYTFHYITPLGVLVEAVNNQTTLRAEGVMPCSR